MIIKIGTDSGKSQSRFAVAIGGSYYLFKFPTVIEEESERAANIGHEVYYDGVRYLVGDSTSINDNDSTKTTKLTFTHELCTYTGIALAMRELGRENCEDEVHITVNTPISVFKDKEDREEVIDFYKDKKVSIKVDGSTYNFVIREVTPYYEGFGAWNNNRDRVGDHALVYDFGSLNTNFIYYKNGTTIGGASTLDIGGSSIVPVVNSKTSKNDIFLTDEHIYKIAKSEPVKNLETKYYNIARDVIQEHVKQIEILTKKTANKIPFALCDVIFSGGAYDVYKEFLKDSSVFSNKNVYVSTENVYDNAIGSLKSLM